MKGRRAAFVLGAFLGALGTQDLLAGDNDRAVPRGGGGGGGGSHGSGGGGAASRHPGSGGGGGSSYSGGGGSSYSGGGSSYSSRGPQTGAQRRQPVPGQGHYGHGHDGGYYGGYGHGHGYYGHGYGYYGGYYPYYWPYWGWGYGYYSPWYYPYYGFYAGFGYPYYGGYVGVSYAGGGGGYAGGGGYYEGAGSVRLIVDPVEAKVYVDGYYAGKVDDFDGMFQRLNLRPGAHDVELKHDGYETHRIKLYVPADHTIKVKYNMVRGDSSHVTEATVGDPADAERYARREEREREYEQPEDREPPPPARIEEGQRRNDDSWSQGRERGTLRLDVTPVDASIYVDGMFRGTGQDLRRLNLPPGRHRLEVVRPGYRTLERDVEVEAGQTEQVQVDLPRS